MKDPGKNEGGSTDTDLESKQYKKKNHFLKTTEGGTIASWGS
jgi:hypothetical protein